MARSLRTSAPHSAPPAPGSGPRPELARESAISGDAHGPVRALQRHPRLWALALGVVSATGFQPLGLWPLALLAMGAFVLLIGATANWRQAAWLGWLFGMGHFTFGNNWIATAFTYQGNMPAVLGWAAVPLLSLYLALFPALASGAARALARRQEGAPLLLAFAGFWIISEWLRGWVLTGYAWNPFGIVLLGPFDRPGLAAIAPWMGTYALSGLAVLIGGALVLAVVERRFLAAALAALLVALGMYWPAGEGREGTLAVTVVQPDLRQEMLNDPLYYERNFTRLAGLSQARGEDEPRLVLWPESGMVDYLYEGYPQRYYDATTAFGSPILARERIGRAIGEGSMLLTGAVELEFDAPKAGPKAGLEATGPVPQDARATGAYNGVTALSADGEIVGNYAKAHLVPFGEYLPFRGLLEPLGLSRLVPGAFDFLPGPGPRTIDLGEYGQAGMQICYEIVFSGQVVDPQVRPDYIFNPSNDGWFGRFGPPQHLAQARLRAIEEGLPVLRSTTTGISALIDGRGVVRDSLGHQEMGRIDAKVPPALPPTLFSRTGNALGLFWALLLLCSTAVAMKRRAR